MAIDIRNTWKPTVPAWEKKFCKAVGSLNWNAFLDMKQYVCLYENILKWNDSAGEEAFHSAKNRFWAELNGIPCTVDIPDPDLYIDEIDWECQIDEELLLDLDRRSVANSDEKSDTVIIFGDSLIPNLPFITGWGTGWGDEEDVPKDHGNEQECWYEKTTGTEKENGAGDYPNNTWHLNKGDGWGSGWNNSQQMIGEADFYSKKNRFCGSDGFWRRWDTSEATGTRTGMPRYNVSRFHGEGHNPNASSRNWKGRNWENYVPEQNKIGRIHHKGRCNMNVCRPNTRQVSNNNARQTWN
ncbi:hypothetical protein Leryth_016688 [Lithospermum erythrorhizon]|nr:hypothetical protein Leryth_016688 [Lithospermum erythrorhizon]